MRRIPNSERLYELVGQNLAQKRNEAKLTQTQLANRCGLTRGSIANIESGNQRPTLHTLWSLANALDVDMRSFLPSSDELCMDEAGIAEPTLTYRLKKAAGESQSQVASFIASSREKVNFDVMGKKS